jgi:hypothetical protein
MKTNLTDRTLGDPRIGDVPGRPCTCREISMGFFMKGEKI